MNLHSEILALARKLRAHANELDKQFVAQCDPRALEGGAHDEEASAYRKVARQVLAAAAELEDYL